MAIPSSGPISLDDLQVEFGGTNPIKINEYYRGGTYVPDNSTNSGVPLSGAISLDDFYGAAASQSRSTTTAWNTTTSWSVYYTTSWGSSWTTSWTNSRSTEYSRTESRTTEYSRTTTTTWSTIESTGPYYNNQQFWQVQIYYPAYGGSTWADIYWNGVIGQNLSAGITSYSSGGYTYYRGSTAASGYIVEQQFTLGTYTNYYVSRSHSTSTSSSTTTTWYPTTYWTTAWNQTTEWPGSRTTSSGDSRTTTTTYSRSTQYSRNTTTTW